MLTGGTGSPGRAGRSPPQARPDPRCSEEGSVPRELQPRPGPAEQAGALRASGIVRGPVRGRRTWDRSPRADPGRRCLPTRRVGATPPRAPPPGPPSRARARAGPARPRAGPCRAHEPRADPGLARDSHSRPHRAGRRLRRAARGLQSRRGTWRQFGSRSPRAPRSDRRPSSPSHLRRARRRWNRGFGSSGPRRAHLQREARSTLPGAPPATSSGIAPESWQGYLPRSHPAIFCRRGQS